MSQFNQPNSVFIAPNCDPNKMDTTTLYAPGDLGKLVVKGQKRYQVVQLKAGETAVVGALAFWSDRTNYVVVAADANAIGGGTTNAWRNQVAGVFTNIPTAGNYCCILQQAPATPVLGATGGGVGQQVIPQTTGTGQVTFIAVGGTASTYQLLGVAREATGGTTANFVTMDLMIQPIP